MPRCLLNARASGAISAKMPEMTKIVTCCYCGTRAALVLRGKERHELSCSACGAPLHEMKMLRAASAAKVAKSAKPKKAKVKKRKSRKRKFFEEAFDFIEDIFD